MTVRTARRARACSLIVPSVMSAGLWVIITVLMLGRFWYAGLAVVVALSAAARTRTGERWVCLLLGARRPRLHQRHTLAPVAQVMRQHGVPPDQLLLVGPGHHVGAKAVGSRTVVVSRGLIDAVRSGHLTAEAAAAVITHELGVLRAGLARHEPPATILLAPWTMWLTFIRALWEAVACFLPRQVMVACLVLNAGVGLWLGLTQEATMLLATAAMATVLTAWWASRSWHRARDQVGDQYLIQTGLALPYAALLATSHDDNYTLDRVVRLLDPDLLGVRLVSRTDARATSASVSPWASWLLRPTMSARLRAASGRLNPADPSS